MVYFSFGSLKYLRCTFCVGEKTAVGGKEVRNQAVEPLDCIPSQSDIEPPYKEAAASSLGTTGGQLDADDVAECGTDVYEEESEVKWLVRKASVSGRAQLTELEVELNKQQQEDEVRIYL